MLLVLIHHENSFIFNLTINLQWAHIQHNGYTEPTIYTKFNFHCTIFVADTVLAAQLVFRQGTDPG